jgi:hypothetical protein
MATHELVDQVLDRNPMPWYVGSRGPDGKNRMFPIRDGNHKVVAYAYNEQVAELITRLIKDAP